jgi:endonuclease/exonuclease/phosphatase (EEP) superfamily protein YafD
VITIDHILTRNAVASSIMAIELAGSDHRSLLANISVPIDPVVPG